MRNIVYLNGDYCQLRDAHVSVLDRGFIFGDGVYEVIPSFNGQLLRLKEHVERLEESLRLTFIKQPDLDLTEIIHQLRERNQAINDAIYCQITRGVDTTRRFLPPKDLTPTVFLGCIPTQTHTIDELRQGLSIVTLPDIRWQACNIKATTLLASVMTKMTADTHGAVDAIFVRDGLAMEGSASNLFIVKGNKLKTPPKTGHILSGITRDLVLELAQKNNIAFEETNIPEAELSSADEIWLTGSTKEIAPVIELNGKKVGQGAAGPVWETMIGHYQAYKKSCPPRTKNGN